MRKKMKNPGRKALAAGAVGLAAAAMVFGATTAASAATGDPNGGIRNITITADSGSFATPGSTGTVTFNRGDGSPAGTFTIFNNQPGGTADGTTWRLQLPPGLKFVEGPDCPADGNDGTVAVACRISADRQVRFVSQWAMVDAVRNWDYNGSNFTWPVVSTGIITGGISGLYVPWTGTTSSATTASLPQSAIPGAGSGFTATGATGPDGSGNCQLTGTAQPGAAITVKDKNGNTAVTGTADSSGNWTVTLPCSTPAPLSITQTVGSDTSAPIEFNTAPLPVMNGVVAAGAIALAGLGFGGARLLRRSRVTA